MTVSRETELLDSYAELLRKWNSSINLIAKSTLQEIETRHIADSRRLAELARAADGPWLDLGSGGGFPGLVLAILRSDLSVSLMESDQRKAAFLRSVIRELKLPNATVICQRIEHAQPQRVGNVSARALAPLPLLMSYVTRHLAFGGTAWLMKGRNWQKEVDDARREWRFHLRDHPSATDPEATILEITGIEHA
ncbi:16S rRNA (guanine(527)-N(7))-methyltransferase RsmG [Paracoccus sp. (in: a-proteobacteria)]|uniref:16S rRNA (guanine(527)-N(7))-methyltransferase RsmG n=1 Tax=Paracoccus sp. TaxID=267 RepID=UPI00321F8429